LQDESFHELGSACGQLGAHLTAEGVAEQVRVRDRG
jgi:hypothetical protein